MKYGLVFLGFATLCAYYAFTLGGAAWLLLWVTLSFGIAGLGYLVGSPSIFGKRSDGGTHRIAWIALLPFRAYVWLGWFALQSIRKENAFDTLAEDIVIGRRLRSSEYPPKVERVLDLTSEFSEPAAIRHRLAYRCFPILDAHVPRVEDLVELAMEYREPGPVLYIHCAQGHGRTITVASAILLARGQAATWSEAVELVQQKRPDAKPNSAQRRFLAAVSEKILESLAAHK